MQVSAINAAAGYARARRRGTGSGPDRRPDAAGGRPDQRQRWRRRRRGGPGAQTTGELTGVLVDIST
ncbi:hypothetical protein ACRAWD_23915 [Caulobacter segnis]